LPETVTKIPWIQRQKRNSMRVKKDVRETHSPIQRYSRGPWNTCVGSPVSAATLTLNTDVLQAIWDDNILGLSPYVLSATVSSYYVSSRCSALEW